MEFPIDIETSKLSPGAQRAVNKVKDALRKTGRVTEHVTEQGLETVAKVAVLALMSGEGISFGESKTADE